MNRDWLYNQACRLLHNCHVISHSLFQTNYPLNCMNVCVAHIMHNFDLGVRCRWVLCFRVERINNLKTNCFEHTYIHIELRIAYIYC